MIAKRILRDTKGRSDFSRLAKYVLTAQGRSDPATWARTADYVLDTAHEGKKVGTVRVTNCVSEDPAMVVAEIKATQARNTRSKTDKTYHLVISFPPGERPQADQLRYIEEQLCASIGFEEHQRLSAVHTDTDHLHVHVAINKVHPKSFSNIEPYFDYKRLMQTCARLEIELNLERTHELSNEHTREPTQESIHEIPDQNDLEQLNLKAAAALRKSYLEEIAREPEAESLNGVRTLSSVGVVQLDGGGEVFLPSDAPHHVESAGSERDDALRRGGDGPGGPESSRGGGLATPIAGRPSQMEAHSSRESLLSFVRQHAREGALAAGSWPDLHQALARVQLFAKPRGAGLVIGTREGLFVKASDVDRRLSFDALSKRFGPFEEARTDIFPIAPERSYQGQPKHAADTAHLFAAYTNERAAALALRTTARARLREAHRRYASELSAWHRAERDRLRADKRHRGRVKFEALRDLSQRKRRDFLNRAALEKTQWAETLTLAPLPTWAAFLQARAAAGDRQALAVLRRRAQSHRPCSNSVRPEHLDSSSTRVVGNYQPQVRKNGDLVYALNDGGVVIDASEHVRVETSSDAAVALALEVAAMRFSGQRLRVEGGGQFGLALARAARDQRSPVEFADVVLEQERLRLTKAPAIAPTAVDVFIARRNNLRSRVSSLDFHKEWKASEAGSLVYAGRRRLKEGSHVLLLKDTDTMWVLPVTESQAAQAAGWKIGRRVQVEEGGGVRIDVKRARQR